MIELKAIAARPAAAPMTLRGKRDAAGNALEYTQMPADADVSARDFIQQVAELHERARGSNGSGEERWRLARLWFVRVRFVKSWLHLQQAPA